MSAAGQTADIVSAITRTVFGHPEKKCGEKRRGENGRKNICRCCGGIPNCLPVPNECHSSCQYCQRKTNSHHCAENNNYFLARCMFASHRQSPIVLIDLQRTSRNDHFVTPAINRGYFFSQEDRKDFRSCGAIFSVTARFLHSSLFCFSFDRFSAAAFSCARSLAAGFAAGPIGKV